MIAPKSVLYCLSAILILFSSVLVSGCGGSTGGSGTPIPPPPTPSTAKEWTWVSGSNAITGANGGQSGVYGALGVEGVGNVPGSRGVSVSWTDKNGNLWLMGGLGFDSTNNDGSLNDLWEFDTTTHNWTWISGSSTLGAKSCGSVAGQPGVYGTIGAANSTNVPGGRQAPAGWTDSSGNLWLFGGYGCDSASNGGYLGDLWEFNTTAKAWTWMGGSNETSAKGAYGKLGTAASSNIPGSRYLAATWTDANGNFWLFGGNGYDSTGTLGDLNDLWEFSPTSKMWTWMSGNSAVNAPSVYGTVNSASSTNVPGARNGACGWLDGSGNLWLFGGQEDSLNMPIVFLNDLWEFNVANSEWTWTSGSNTANTPGEYGTMGAASPSNNPGGRTTAVSWKDRSGNLWLFGGDGYDSTGTYPGDLNDLWEFSPATKSWTWMGGTNSTGGKGVYGTQGVAAARNLPGSREGTVWWTDTNGNFWLFSGLESTPNDLWRFQP